MSHNPPFIRSALREALGNMVLPLRQQLDVRNAWLRHRLETVIPQIMAREGFDMWLIIAREYNEDPVMMSMLPQPAMSARRRSILAFCRNADGSVDRLTIDRYGHGDFYAGVWQAGQESQDDALKRIVTERDPQHIGINLGEDFAFGDGLTHTEYLHLMAVLGEDYAPRVRSAQALCIGWLESRTEPELTAYPGIIQMGHMIIAEAFSRRVIHPGITTVDDVRWWMRQTMHDFGLQAWFHPSCDIQAPGQPFAMPHMQQDRRKVIMPGDLLWCDMGFIYLGLATDQQQHAYVLKPDENDAPDGLKTALQAGNQLQDIVMQAIQPGLSGNDVLKVARQQALDVGLTPSIYCHPIGYHGHAAGPMIGLWDQQEGVPGRGDYLLYDNTAYSIELNVQVDVPEWDGQTVTIALEEDAVLTNGAMHWLDGRQERLHLIG